jgi:tetrahydromethanopterin S-methyltransferase subunit F
MNGLGLIFGSGGPYFDLSGKLVTGFNATVQNALVCAGTIEGSDPLFPTRGTTLLADGTNGRMVNLGLAQTRANLAALGVLEFIQSNDVPQNADVLQDIQFKCQSIKDQGLSISVMATSTTGQTVGIVITQ